MRSSWIPYSGPRGQHLRPPGEAERGLIQAYIDDLLVVARTLQHFIEGVKAVAAYLRMMGMEPDPSKCAMATTKRVPGLQLRLCQHLDNPWHWVPAADSVPYLGLQLQPDGEFSLQRKHRLCLAAVHHWRLNTLAPPKVVQDVILAILGGLTQYVGPSSPTSQTPRATWTTSRSRSQSTGHSTPPTPHGSAYRKIGTMGLTWVPTSCQQVAVALIGMLVHHRSASMRPKATRMF